MPLILSAQATQEGLGRCEPVQPEPPVTARMSAVIETTGIAFVEVSQEQDVAEDSAA
jgi:hypothetical protein